MNLQCLTNRKGHFKLIIFVTYSPVFLINVNKQLKTNYYGYK